MCKHILAKTQKMRPSDEASAKPEKVSNHGCQLPTKQRHWTQAVLQPKAGRLPAGVGCGWRIASPLSGSLIWGKTKWEHLSHVHDCDVLRLDSCRERFSRGELRLLS